MNKTVLEALKGSIKKWEAIVDGTGRDRGIRNCPLCAIFFEKKDCGRCPVKVAVKDWFCCRTPYSSWSIHRGRYHVFDEELSVKCPICKRLAKAEVRFLKSLLPGKKKG